VGRQNRYGRKAIDGYELPSAARRHDLDAASQLITDHLAETGQPPVDTDRYEPRLVRETDRMITHVERFKHSLETSGLRSPHKCEVHFARPCIPYLRHPPS
jgi:hypothetical protein